MAVKLVKAVLILFFLTLSFCSQSQDPEFRSYRFIDRLTLDSVEETPLHQPSSSLQRSAGLYPEGSYPLPGLLETQNPLGLKRKLKLGGTERNILFAPTDSQFVFDLEFPENCRLEFGIGIAITKSMVQKTKSSQKGATFIISLEMRDRERTIFQEYAALPQDLENELFVFELHSLELIHPGEDARITFRVEGEDGISSFWANPVLYSPGGTGTNVILICVDTLRADHLSCYGYARETSPSIDALAADSVLFEQAYASSPWTLPSHVALMTGRHGVHHQVYHENERMDPGMPTLAEIFASQQYACAAFTGGGFVSPVFGFSRGFDTYDVGAGGVFHQDSAERVFQAASGWLDRFGERDFFLFLHTYQTHSPYACPPPYKVKYLNDDSLWGHVDLIQHLGGKENLFRELPELERQNIIDLYDGEISYTDDQLIRPLLAKLTETGLYDKTLIIFLSDHGEEFYEHGGWGHGHSLYDESLKVPLIVKFPDSRYKAQRCGNIVSLVDLMPTILDVMGWDSLENGLDGRSLIPFLTGDETEDRVFLADVGSNVLDFHLPQRIATNRGQTKLILSQRSRAEDLEFFITPPPQIGPVELYDLSLDPGETLNLADQKPDLASKVIRWLNDFYAQAKKSRVSKVEIDESVKEQLKALGYIK
jgi:arylsulfatase A-like enzyme